MSATEHPRARLHPTAAALAIALATLLPFLRVAGHQFLGFDDDLYVHDNEWVRQGLSRAGAAWAFTTFHAGNWHPLTWMSHMLDVELFGLAPSGHHLVNVLLHAANAALLFLVLHAMTSATGRSAVVALLFAVHPLHVESVAWVAERKDVLSTALGLLALGAYVRYARRRSWPRYLAVVAAFVASLMAKPMWVTFPFLLLLLDAWPLRRLEGIALADAGPPTASRVTPAFAALEKVPLVLISAASSIVTFVAQARWGAVVPLELGLGDRIANAVVSYVLYVAKTFWPWPLAAYYPLRREVPGWEPIAAAALLVVATAAALGGVKRRPWLLIGWLWFLGTLVPVIGLVQVGGQAMADRYTYLPIVGLFVAVAWQAHEWMRAQWRAAAAAGAVVILAGFTWVQTGYWKDHETLFRHAIEVTEGNALAHYNLGTHLVETGRLAEARPLMIRATQLDPENSGAWNALGNFALLDGNALLAVELYGRAISASGSLGNFEARYNLALSLARLGRCDDARRSDPRRDPGVRDSRAHADIRRRILASGDPLERALRHSCP